MRFLGRRAERDRGMVRPHVVEQYLRSEGATPQRDAVAASFMLPADPRFAGSLVRRFGAVHSTALQR